MFVLGVQIVQRFFVIGGWIGGLEVVPHLPSTSSIPQTISGWFAGILRWEEGLYFGGLFLSFGGGGGWVGVE